MKHICYIYFTYILLIQFWFEPANLTTLPMSQVKRSSETMYISYDNNLAYIHDNKDECDFCYKNLNLFDL